ncbi:MAG: bifunctional diaminohydroxyphosphoribosylaminopyrimidine deaminase/5-amino-6-(5-phosphoribosylamino)uracil reductase RibD [Deltaproteobacteria bacterium]|nr:bifunctional diaminohydroxyphosphoribosylaminopyrimidine deaminase/5-amino-6-(5-phosphoribosylamino)uracil reductase RibD [Deltaproteobacteria bacterium]
MRVALAAARRHRPSPNPRVGAVVAKRGEVIAVGAHRRAGEDHAEVVALERAGGAARGADLYVTLEPCNHWGLTAPCTDAIVAAGVERVVIGCRDPNPNVRGGGATHLRKAGIEVVESVCEAEAAELVEDFTKAVRDRLPLVTLKLAETLDGRIATRTGDARWITGPEARREAHRLRAAHDAILVGVGTVLADDPALTTRLVSGPSPVRVVVDSRLRTPLDAAVLRGGATIAYSSAPSTRVKRLEAAGMRLIRCPGRSGRVDLRLALSKLALSGVLSVLVEGGGEIAGSMLDAGLVDRVVVFVSPRIVGGADAVAAVAGRGVARLADAHRLAGVRIRRLGDDLMVAGRFNSPGPGPHRRRTPGRGATRRGGSDPART